MNVSLNGLVGLDLLARAGPPQADITGLLVVLAVFSALGLLALWLTMRPRQKQPPKQLDTRAKAEAPAGEPVDKQARMAAKALRRAAKGAIKVKRSGEREQIDAIDFSDAAPAAPAVEPAPVVAEDPAADRAAKDREKVHGGLAKTRKEGFVARLGKLFAGKQIDEDLLDQIEEVLFRADIGVQATASLLDTLKKGLSRKELTDADMVWAALKARSLEMLREVEGRPLRIDAKLAPAVLMVVGVNGSGKTTTIGKLAHRFAGEGRRQLVAAGDTFRAAAVDQLEVWCQRAGVEMFRGKEKQDPASVCFEALQKAQQDGHDLVIVDTAGRLHTNRNLMAELDKVSRVCHKAHAGAPHEILLVLDATMGQNAVQQARVFSEAVPVTGIALTKLDGTAKGGVVLAIAATLGMPVKLIGVGEKMGDLRDFDPEIFVEALFEHDEA